MNDRQKNFNGRGFNFPYIQRPPYHSSSMPLTSKPEEITEYEELADPEEIAKPEEIAEYEEIADPEEIAEYEESVEFEETVEREETFEPEETFELEETFEPEKTDEPEELTAFEDTGTYEESDASEEADTSKEAGEPAGVEDISIHDTDKLEDDAASGQNSMQIASVILDEINAVEEFEVETENNDETVAETVAETNDQIDSASSEPDIHEAEESIDTSEEIQAASIEISNKKQHEEKINISNEDSGEIPSIDGLYGRGLFHYKKWWFRYKIEISVNGQLICGIPIFTDHNTLRVVNEKHSYFIPVEKIDYIRTTDGLNF